VQHAALWGAVGAPRVDQDVHVEHDMSHVSHDQLDSERSPQITFGRSLRFPGACPTAAGAALRVRAGPWGS